MSPVPRRRTSGSRAAEIVVIVRGRAWRRAAPNAAALSRCAAAAALAATGSARGHAHKVAHRKKLEIVVVLASDAFVAKLNRDYRGKEGPTNVLSFPSGLSEVIAGEDAVPLGDIVIALETSRREAKAAGLPLAHHLAHLVVHGVLHLLGYDHEKAKNAALMEELEAEILRALGITDPYRPQRAARVA